MYNIEDIDYINEETSIRFYGEWTDPLAEKNANGMVRCHGLGS